MHPISINLPILTLPERNPLQLEPRPGACGTQFGFAPLANLSDAVVTTAHPLPFPVTLSHFQHAHIPTHSYTESVRARRGSLHRSPTRSFQTPGDGEHRLTRERGMKTESRKKRSAGGKKVAGWRTSFLGIKLCIFSSLLIDQLPQDISMPNERPAASVYSALQERRLNQTHFSKEKLYLL